MVYARKNYKTKKEFLADVRNPDVDVFVYRHGPIFRQVLAGLICVEGPHYPEPHRWYASAIVDSNGKVVSAQ